MARELKYNTATTVTVGPAIDVTSGTITVNAADVDGIDCGIRKQGVAGAAIVLTTSGTANDMVPVANNPGYYDMELAAGNVDTLGRLRVTFNDPDVFLPFWEDFEVVTAAEYDRKYSTGHTVDEVYAQAAAIQVDVTSALTNVAAVKVDTASSLAKINTLTTNVAAVKVDTASSLVKINTLTTNVAAVKVDTASSLVRVTALGVAAASSLAKIDIIDTVVDGIQVDMTSTLTNIGTIDTVVDGIQVDVTSALTNIGTVDTVVDGIQVDVTSALVNIAAIDVSGVADAVWDEVMSDHTTSGTTGEALNAAGAAGDPWITELPGSYTGIQAGSIISGINVNVASSLVNIAAVKVDTASSLVWIASTHTNVANVASSTWDIVRASHVTAGTFGEVSTVASAVTAVWAADEAVALAQASSITSLDTLIDTVKVDTASSLAKIDTLTTNVAAVKVETASSLAKIDIIDTVVDGIQVDMTSTLTNIGTVDTVVDAIKVDTASSLAKIDTIDTVTDGIQVDVTSALTNIAAVKVDTASSLVLIGELAQASAIVSLDTLIDTVKVDTASSLAKIDLIQGIGFKGTVTDVPDPDQFTVSAMAGLGAGALADTTNPYHAFVFRDAGGAGAAPQGEMKKILAYNSTTGNFTCSSFTAAITAGDEVIIMHPRVAELLSAPYGVWDELIAGHTTTGSMAAKLTSMGTDITSALTNIAALPTDADVNAQVLDVLNVDTFAEPGQGNLAATTSLVSKIGYLYKFLRNKITTTATSITVFNDAGSTADQKSTISDDSTTFTRGEFGTGA